YPSYYSPVSKDSPMTHTVTAPGVAVSRRSRETVASQAPGSYRSLYRNDSENERMRYHALACDYDGTLAHNGRVNDETMAALERLRGSGRQLIMVTGRELDD